MPEIVQALDMAGLSSIAADLPIRSLAEAFIAREIYHEDGVEKAEACLKAVQNTRKDIESLGELDEEAA